MSTSRRTYFEVGTRILNSICTVQSASTSGEAAPPSTLSRSVLRPNEHDTVAKGSHLSVTKRVSPSFFQLSQELRKEFPHSQNLRMHVDCNKREHVLMYHYYKHTFLALLRQYPNFPPTEIKKILRCTAEAVKELHDKDWIHIGQLTIAEFVLLRPLFTDAAPRHSRCQAR